jgi:hypothetical protein
MEALKKAKRRELVWFLLQKKIIIKIIDIELVSIKNE